MMGAGKADLNEKTRLLTPTRRKKPEQVRVRTAATIVDAFNTRRFQMHENENSQPSVILHGGTQLNLASVPGQTRSQDVCRTPSWE